MSSKKRDGNLAFKVTFNDKRWHGVCSPKIYERNIKKKIYWCCNQAPNCQTDYKGKELGEKKPPCYDSVALRHLRFSPGWKHGENTEPYKCKDAQKGKITLLTSLEPGAAQSERFIFAVYKTEKKKVTKDGTEYYCGESSTAIKLAKSQYMRFWNYYRNPKAPEKEFWGSGLYRYPSDFQVRRVLKDIIKSVIFTRKQKQTAKKLLRRVS